MLEGKKNATGVATLNEEAYEGEELKKARKEIMEAVTKENQMGYYD